MTTQQNQPPAPTPATIFETKLRGLEQVAKSRDAAKDGVRDTNRKADVKGFEVVSAYAKSTNAERVEYDKLMDKVASERGIRFKEDTPRHYRLTRMSLGRDKSQTSDKTRIFNAALVDGIDPAGYVAWIEKETERKIKATRHMDGTVRKDPRILSPNKQQKTDLIDRAKAELNNKVIATVQTDNLDEVTFSKEYAGIIMQHPDGTLVIKAMVDDPKVTDAVYVSFGKTLPTPTDEEKILEGAKQLLAKVTVTPDEMEEKLGKDVADEGQQAWSDVLKKYKANEEKITSGIDEYCDWIKDADQLDAVESGSGSEEYKIAIKVLVDLQSAGMPIYQLFDRDISIDIKPDVKSVPRLLLSSSPHKLHPLMVDKTRVYHNFLKNELAGYLERRNAQAPEATQQQTVDVPQPVEV